MRGPQYWDLRAGLRPREGVNLSAHLVETPVFSCKSNAGTQSDSLLPAPREPTFDEVRGKMGIDAASQVPHGERARGAKNLSDSLFDFDTQVAPRINLLCRDVIAQALEELSHEGDLEVLRARRALNQASRDADAATAAALRETARAHGIARDAAVSTARAAYARQLSAIERVSAVGMAGGAVRGTIEAAFARARAEGWLVDADRAAVENVLVPRLIADVARRTKALANGGGVSSLVDSAIAAALRIWEPVVVPGVAALSEASASSSARFAIKVYVRLPVEMAGEDIIASTGAGAVAGEGQSSDASETPVQVITEAGFFTVVVGPIRIARDELVGVVETRISDWLCAKKGSRAVARVLLLAGGLPLGLHLGGVRLPRDAQLLATPLETLGGLELRPIARVEGGAAGWLLETPPPAVAAAAAAVIAADKANDDITMPAVFAAETLPTPTTTHAHFADGTALSPLVETPPEAVAVAYEAAAPEAAAPEAAAPEAAAPEAAAPEASPEVVAPEAAPEAATTE